MFASHDVAVQDETGSEPPGISLQELQLATRNHGMPLEALRYDLTPAGLHYLLIHYDVPEVDPATWTLRLDGLVHRPTTLDLDGFGALPRTTVTTTMECAGNGRALLDPRPVSQPWIREAVGTAAWGGVRLTDVLDRAGVDETAAELVFTGLDRGIEGGQEQSYARSLPLHECRRPEVLLADEMNGAPLLPQHGAPVRLVVPGWYGMTNVKWLARIEAVGAPFRGYQNEHGYRFRTNEDEPGEPVTRIVPRALIEPPGIPDFLSRERSLAPGPVTVRGRAWSGRAPIVAVQASTDDGATWSEASLGPEMSPWAWRAWWMDWEAPEGRHVLRARARDAAEGVQPDEPVWNVGGYANNAVHRVSVTVTGASAETP
jgi:DMSO/TMAO reductase YedYZ molybdopterin-dependent catalytic subunit